MPAISLGSLPTESESEPLEVVATAVIGKGDNAYTLGVGKTPTGDHVLIRERSRYKKGADGKREKDNGSENYWKRTPRLADFAAALAADLIG